MHIDRKLMHRLFVFAAGILIFAWLLLDTARAGTLFLRIWEIVSPFVIGAGIAFIFNVPMRAIERGLSKISRPGLRRGAAILLTLCVLFLVILLVVELLIPQLSMTIQSLRQTIPAFVERTASNLMIFMDDNPTLKEYIAGFLHVDNIEWSSLIKQMLTFIGDSVSSVMGGAVNVIGNIANTIVNAVISTAFAVYCLARKEILACQGRKLVYAFLPERYGDQIVRILRLTNTTFSSFISGQCLEACILGALFAVSMLIFGMPYIPLVSVIIAVTALIPVVGAFIGCVVGAFFILVNDPVQALSFIAMFLVIQQLENNLIYPRVVGTSIGLPGMWVLVAVTIGGELMGVGGMLVMIPLTSVMYTLLRELTQKRLEERNIPREKLVNDSNNINSDGAGTVALRNEINDAETP